VGERRLGKSVKATSGFFASLRRSSGGSPQREKNLSHENGCNGRLGTEDRGRRSVRIPTIAAIDSD
jgi:hypothetical protein